MTVLPDFSQFEALARSGNFIPVYREWIADLDTPVSAWYRVCADQPYSFLLESVEGENIWLDIAFWDVIQSGFWKLAVSKRPRPIGMDR